MGSSDMFLELWWWLFLLIFIYVAYDCYRCGKDCESWYLRSGNTRFKKLSDDFYTLATTCLGSFIILTIIACWVLEVA